MKYSFTILWSTLILLLTSCATTSGKSRPIAMKCGHLFNSERGEWEKDQTLLIQDGKILSVNPEKLPPETETIDYSRFWVSPGLIDAHTHVFLEDPTYGRDFAGGLLKFMKTHSDSERKEIGEKRLVSLLKAGFTSVRDLGNQGAVDLHHVRESGARLFSSGPGFSPADGQLPKGSSPELLRKEYLPLSKLPENFTYDVVKLYADEDPNPTIADTAVLKKWVEWAHQRGLKVAGHAILSGGIDAAIEAGVDSLEHGTQMTLPQMKKLKKKGIIFVPTYADYLFLLPQGKKHQWSWTPEVTRKTCGNIRAARALDVPLAFGSDNYFSLEDEGLSFGDATREILLGWLECGLSVNDLLRASTYTAARSLGLEKKLGVLTANAFADLVVYEEDPVKNPATMKRPCAVMKGGEKKF